MLKLGWKLKFGQYFPAEAWWGCELIIYLNSSELVSQLGSQLLTSITKHFSFILNSSELVSQLGSQLLTSIAWKCWK